MGLKDLVNKFEHKVNTTLAPNTYKTQNQPPPQSHQQPSPSTSSLKSKRGLCWPVENEDPTHTFTKPGSKISWIYNWSPNPVPSDTSLEFIPMQWNTVGIDDMPSKISGSGCKTVLLFNEPELPDQSNISAEVAAREYLRVIEPLRKSGVVRVGSPGISNAGHAIGWLKDFHDRIRSGGGDVDFWCFHWYGPELGGFYDYIWSTHHQLDPMKPVWITEFACTNWSAEAPMPREHVENFARESVKYLDTLDWVERYCWFGPMRDVGTVGKWARMLDDEGRLTELGRAYRDD